MPIDPSAPIMDNRPIGRNMKLDRGNLTGSGGRIKAMDMVFTMAITPLSRDGTLKLLHPKDLNQLGIHSSRGFARRGRPTAVDMGRLDDAIPSGTIVSHPK